MFDVAAAITNDSDVFEPIRVVVQELGKPVGVIIPGEGHSSAKLKQIASFTRSIRRSALAASQFSPTLQDSIGTFTKPTSW